MMSDGNVYTIDIIVTQMSTTTLISSVFTLDPLVLVWENDAAGAGTSVRVLQKQVWLNF
jgi:hypothetical protein